MKKFIYNIIILLFIFIILVLIPVFILKTTSNKSYLKQSKDNTILILGDSRTEAALDDSIVKKSKNFSNSGDHIFFNYIKLKKLVEQNEQINKVVLSFSPGDLDSPSFYMVTKMKGRFITYFDLIDFIDYKDIIVYNFEGFIRGITGISRLFIKSYEIGGFIKLPIDPKYLDADIRNKTFIYKTHRDKLAIKYFNIIIDFCKINNIELIVINTPLHKSLSKRQIERKLDYKNFINNYSDDDFKYLDFEFFKLDDKYFFDTYHLNQKGAEIFSIYFNDNYETLIKEKQWKR